MITVYIFFIAVVELLHTMRTPGVCVYYIAHHYLESNLNNSIVQNYVDIIACHSTLVHKNLGAH